MTSACFNFPAIAYAETNGIELWLVLSIDPGVDTALSSSRDTSGTVNEVLYRTSAIIIIPSIVGRVMTSNK